MQRGSTTFDALKVGDRIYWRGADGSAATVITRVDNGGGPAVTIRWQTNDEDHQSTLRWGPKSVIHLYLED